MKKKAWIDGKRTSLLYKSVLCVVYWFFRVFYKHKIYGLSHCPKGAAIIAPNHASFYDPPLVSVSCNEEVHFLARKSLFNNYFFGGLIRKLNAHPVSGRSEDVSVFKTILGLLNEGKKVLLFPEGKRSFHGELGKIKPGFSFLLSKSKAALWPVYVHGTYEVWSRKRKVPKLFGRTACIFGSPIYMEQFAHIDKKRVQEELSLAISTSILGLKKWYEEGAKGSLP